MKVMLQAKKGVSSRSGLIFSFIAIIDEGNGKYKIVDLDEHIDYTHDPMRAMFEFMRLAEKYCDSEPSLTSKTRMKKVEEILELENYRKILEKEDEESYRLKELGREYLRLQKEKEERAAKRKAPKKALKEDGKMKSSKKKVVEKPAEPDFEDMKVDELRNYAKDKNIKLGRSVKRKADIIDALRKGA